MHMLAMTQDLALQIERSKADHIDSWFRGMLERSGNLFDVSVYRAGSVKAFAARNMQEIGLFNQVIGLGPEHMKHVPEIIRFYHEQGVTKYRLEINPFHTTPDFLAYLASLDFYHSGFQTYIYGLASSVPFPDQTTLSLQEVTSSEVDLFADIHVEGFQEALSHIPETTVQRYRESTKVLYGLPGWHLYLVRVHGVPAGMGMLYRENGIASLTGGATLPQFRGKGCHRALLSHRIQAAAQMECHLIVAQTSVGSVSQYNMERLGLHIAYTAAMWVPME